LIALPFWNKGKLQVNLGNMSNQTESLADFLKARLNAIVLINQNVLEVTLEGLSSEKLLQAVTKFIYHKKLNSVYFATLDGNTVKINEFKDKAHKDDKSRKDGPHKSLTQTWGI
jgi:hypothetical protein